jgi:hypothetical protein
MSKPGAPKSSCNPCSLNRVACRGVFLYCEKWKTVQNCPSMPYQTQVPTTHPCIRCAKIHKPCDGNYALCYRFPWHLFSNKENLVLTDDKAIKIDNIPTFQTFDNKTPAPQPLPFNEFPLILPSTNLEIGERGSKELAITVKVCKNEGDLYKEVIMELDTGSDVTWITSALFNFLKLEKIETETKIYGHGGYEVPILFATNLIIKIRKVKIKIQVYVNDDTNYLGGIIGKDLMKSMGLNIFISEGKISVTCDGQIFITSLYVGENNNELQTSLSDNE